MRTPLRKPILWMVLIALACWGIPAAWAQEETGGPAQAAPPAASPMPFEIPKLAPGEAGANAASSSAGSPGAPHAGLSAPPAGTLTAPAGMAPPASVQGTGMPREDIRDIQGPIEIPASRAWFWVVVGALATMAALAAFWRWYRRRAVVRARRAYEIAFDELEKVKALMQSEQARAFSYRVSETVRVYIDRRFGVGARHRTTEEFIRDLLEKASSPLTHHTELLRDFLGHCDLAKFARGELSVEQMQAMHRSAWDFVEGTRPRPEEETRAAKRSSRKKTTATAPANTPALAAGGVS